MSQSVLLKIIEGKLSGEEFVFEDNGPYLIGRAHSCALRFSDDVDLKMSRRHLILVLDDDEMRIRDLGSRNGTEVNGTRLPVGKINKVPEAKTAEDYVLKPGDVVKIGNLAFAFEFTEKTASSLSPLISSKTPGEKAIAKLPQVGFKKPASSSKPALNVEPAAAKPSLPVESKSESEKTVKPLPVLLTPKITGKKLNLKQSNDSTKVPISTNPLLTLKKGDAKPSSPSDSIVEKDVFEKLGTLDETVAMEPVEFDNLDDLVF
ncbi:MAG: FHA domain-containing protein, partial [Victivallales bacterium]|nr:FHA domain-containing protein [Victivallales bacterium]